MSKKHKPIEKWVARVVRPHKEPMRVETYKIMVIETAKQYRLCKDDPNYNEAARACGYRNTFLKRSGNIFDTEADALAQLLLYHNRLKDRAEDVVRAEVHKCSLILDLMEKAI